MSKRFQECNWLEKTWRYRWYAAVPFQWMWYQYVVQFKVGIDEMVDGEYMHTDKYEVYKDRGLWNLIIGDNQIKMKWYYTHEEVMSKFKTSDKDE